MAVAADRDALEKSARELRRQIEITEAHLEDMCEQLTEIEFAIERLDKDEGNDPELAACAADPRQLRFF